MSVLNIVVHLTVVALTRCLVRARACCGQVREGQWGTQAAVYKVWDLGDSLDPLQEMQAEAFAYNKLKPLQASLYL